MITCETSQNIAWIKSYCKIHFLTAFNFEDSCYYYIFCHFVNSVLEANRDKILI